MSLKDLGLDVSLRLMLDPTESRQDLFEFRQDSEFAFPCCICKKTDEPEEWCKTNCRFY